MVRPHLRIAVVSTIFSFAFRAPRQARSIAIAVAAGLAALAGPAPHAQAATTIYVDSSDPAYPGFPDALNAGASLMGPDGVSATLPVGAFISYLVQPRFNDAAFEFEFTGIGAGVGAIRLYVGETDGAGGFTALDNRIFLVGDGFNTITSAPLTAFCQGLGGCDTFVVQSAFGTLGLDSIVASAPEPSAWALMILGFAALSWRLKAMRGETMRGEAMRGEAAATGQATLAA